MAEAKIRIHMERRPDGGFTATCPDVPGLVADGRTIPEAVEAALAQARNLIASYTARRETVPAALTPLERGKVAVDVLIPEPPPK